MRRRRVFPAFTAGMLAILVIAVASYLAYTRKLPFGHKYTVNAVFHTANNLRIGAKVRIAGVNVGTVSNVERQSQDAIVSMQLDPDALPLHADATAKIRPQLFLEGNWFVDLTQGTPEAPVLHDGGTIPIQDTATPVQLDQVLDALQTDTRSQLQSVLKNYSQALAGGGAQAYRASIPYWAPAYEYGAEVNQATLGNGPDDLPGFIRSAGAVAQATDRNPAQLRRLVVDFDSVAAALAGQHNALTATVNELPHTLQAGIPALQAVNAALPPVNRLAARALPAVRSSGPTIDVSLPLLRQSSLLVSQPELRGLVADLRPTIPALAKLDTELVPLYQLVRQASSCQNRVILPWTHLKIDDPRFPAKGPVYQEAVQWLPGVAGESRSRDANGQWFRTLAGAGTSTLPLGGGRFDITPFPILGVNPQKPAGPQPLEPNVPCETQGLPQLASTAGPAPHQIHLGLDSPAAVLRSQQAQQFDVNWLEAEIKQVGLQGLLHVTNTPFTASQLHAPDLGHLTPNGP